MRAANRAAVFSGLLAVVAGCSLPPPQTDSKAAVGQAAPSFELAATGGKKLSLAELTSGKTAVLVFYRGDW